jgi:hypothetical protein
MWQAFRNAVIFVSVFAGFILWSYFCFRFGVVYGLYS